MGNAKNYIDELRNVEFNSRDYWNVVKKASNDSDMSYSDIEKVLNEVKLEFNFRSDLKEE